MENTTATLQVKKDNHVFDFNVFRDNVGFVVTIRQTTDLTEIGEDEFKTTYKCACPHSQTEHDAIHYAGRKYLKGWNYRARLGKDNPLVHA